MSLVIPRYPVPIWKLFLRMGGWWVIVLGLLLFFFSLGSSFSFNLAERFEEEGRTASALINKKYTTQSTDSDGDTTTTYWFELSYVTQKKEEIDKKTSVVGTTYRAYEPGDRFDLIYLESEPDRIEVNPGSNRSASRWMQVMAAVMGAGWLFLLWLIGGWAVAAVRARRYGRRESVVVKEVETTNIRVNGRARRRLVWKETGGREGRSLLQHPRRVEGFRSGDVIEIYHGLKYSWWVGDIGEREEFAQ